MASEVGVLPIDEANIRLKGRLQPGKMFLVDMREGRIISDKELKGRIATQKPYKQWVQDHQVNLEDLPDPGKKFVPDFDSLLLRQTVFGYNGRGPQIHPGAPWWAKARRRPVRWANDTPLAVLSEKPQLLFHYFKQLFAQVTQPGDRFDPRGGWSCRWRSPSARNSTCSPNRPSIAKNSRSRHPILTLQELEKIRNLDQPDLKSTVLPMLFKAADGEKGLEKALDALCKEASRAIEDGRDHSDPVR